jgi:hypothetical protein
MDFASRAVMATDFSHRISRLDVYSPPADRNRSKGATSRGGHRDPRGSARKPNFMDTNGTPCHGRRNEVPATQAGTAAGSKAPVGSGSKRNMETFPEKMMQILESAEYEDAIWWNPDRVGFSIVPKKFTEKVLTKYFQGTKFESFVRKLNRWGFKRVKGTGFNCVRMFNHDMFHEGKPELLKNMRIVKKEERDWREQFLWQERLSHDYQMAARQSAAMRRLRLSEPAFEQQSGVADAGPLASAHLGFRSPSSTFFVNRSINHQDVNQVRPIAGVSTAYRLLQSLGSSPTMSSSLLVDRSLDDQLQANRVDSSTILQEINRLEEERNAVISAAGLRHRLLQAQRDELFGVAPLFRSSSSTDVLTSRILQAASMVPPAVTPRASLRFGPSLLNSVTPFSSVGVGYRREDRHLY